MPNFGKTKKEVMFLRPRDKRGEKLIVTKETDRSILCEQSDPIHRFIKVGSSFIYKDGGKTSIRFFGIEGSAYTAMLKPEDPVSIPVVQFLQTLWGAKIYNALPQKMKDAVEKDKLGITIEPTKINADDLGLDKLTSDDVNDEGDATILQRLAKFGQSDNPKAKLLNNLIWVGLGIGIAAILANCGWFG